MSSRRPLRVRGPVSAVVGRLLLARVFFAFLLLFAQQQAVLHALGHDLERVQARAVAGSHDATEPDDAFCAKCLSIAHLDHPTGVAAATLPVASYAPPRIAVAPGVVATPVFEGVYRSRAPPVLS